MALNLQVLLLENINPNAGELFTQEGFEITSISGSISEEELLQVISKYTIICIRSKTKITEKVLRAAENLRVIGCFCIGTDQVNLDIARSLGIVVFNSPFANTRSVAELVMCEIVALSRKLCDISRDLHNGNWKKSDKGCNEVRGKSLGIVGYGHVGSQVGLLAESFGMKVRYYDIVPKLSFGNVTSCDSLDELLRSSDYVTLNVPKDKSTVGMISARELELMKVGSYLLNASRGSVCIIEAIVEKLRSGHLAGCAIDVYPSEPQENSLGFVTPLQGCPNTILTPHIGGSTLEAQNNIAKDVSNKILRYFIEGSTVGAVNFPNICCSSHTESVKSPKVHRIINIHSNIPGILKRINSVLSKYNSISQQLVVDRDIGYTIVDLSSGEEELYSELRKVEHSIHTRILF